MRCLWKFTLFSFAVFSIAVSTLAVRAFRGEVVEESSSGKAGPVVKVRKMQSHPFSVIGLLGWGEPVYRVEYYRWSGEPMEASVSLVGESQYERKIKILWSSGERPMVNVDGVDKLHWTADGWRTTELKAAQARGE